MGRKKGDQVHQVSVRKKGSLVSDSWGGGGWCLGAGVHGGSNVSAPKGKQRKRQLSKGGELRREKGVVPVERRERRNRESTPT